jgi:hypothetical protein
MPDRRQQENENVTDIPIPRSPVELTAEWLSSVLADSVGLTPNIASVAVGPIGTGQTAATYRLSVTYGDPAPELDRTFVVKLASQDPAVRDRVALGCRSEVAFYETIAATVRIPLPTCYYSAIADEGARFVLLLSDLAPSTQGDQIAGCTPKAARSAVVALAGLHGPRWCDPEWSAVTGIVMSKPDDSSARGLGEITRIAIDKLLGALGSRLTPACRDVLDSFPESVADWLLLRPDRFSILHGDYRLDNIMFSPDEDQVHIVDWQTTAVGLPARDLSYFVATSLSPGQRREQERALVEAYHAALLAEGVAGYGIDSCFEDYRIGLLQAPMIAALGWAFSAATDRGDEMMIAMVERASTAINELETLPLIGRLADA